MPRPKSLKTQPWKKDVKYVHVNQHHIKKSNSLRLKALNGELSQEDAVAQMPDCMTVKFNKSNTYGSVVVIRDPETGKEVGRFEHSPFAPYSCGAQIVFQTTMDVEILQATGIVEEGCELTLN